MSEAIYTHVQKKASEPVVGCEDIGEDLAQLVKEKIEACSGLEAKELFIILSANVIIISRNLLQGIVTNYTQGTWSKISPHHRVMLKRLYATVLSQTISELSGRLSAACYDLASVTNPYTYMKLLNKQVGLQMDPGVNAVMGVLPGELHTTETRNAVRDALAYGLGCTTYPVAQTVVHKGVAHITSDLSHLFDIMRFIKAEMAESIDHVSRVTGATGAI